MSKPKKIKWRTSNEIRGNMTQLIYAINHPAANASRVCVMLNEKVARNLIEICRQAIHTEEGHEPSTSELLEMQKSMR